MFFAASRKGVSWIRVKKQLLTETCYQCWSVQTGAHNVKTRSKKKSTTLLFLLRAVLGSLKKKCFQNAPTPASTGQTGARERQQAKRYQRALTLRPSALPSVSTCQVLARGRLLLRRASGHSRRSCHCLHHVPLLSHTGICRTPCGAPVGHTALPLLLLTCEARFVYEFCVVLPSHAKRLPPWTKLEESGNPRLY